MPKTLTELTRVAASILAKADLGSGITDEVLAERILAEADPLFVLEWGYALSRQRLVELIQSKSRGAWRRVLAREKVASSATSIAQPYAVAGDGGVLLRRRRNRSTQETTTKAAGHPNGEEVVRDFTVLLTWEKESNFRYSGSVLAGTVIQYGRGFRYRTSVSSSDYRTLLRHFSEMEVPLGTRRSERSENSLGQWLVDHVPQVTKVAIAACVGPILLAEGYAKVGAKLDLIEFTVSFCPRLGFVDRDRESKPGFFQAPTRAN
jgi:hypothetical protein